MICRAASKVASRRTGSADIMFCSAASLSTSWEPRDEKRRSSVRASSANTSSVAVHLRGAARVTGTACGGRVAAVRMPNA